MVLDLGERSEDIRITPEYSNAVAKAILPYFSHVAEKLDLPPPQKISVADIEHFTILPFRNLTVSAKLKNGEVFSFGLGFVQTYISPQSPNYSHLTPDTPSDGSKPLSQQEALDFARTAIKDLGISLEDVLADRDPVVSIYNKPLPHSVARYRFQWPGPYGDFAADMIINPQMKTVERFHFGGLTNLRRPPPQIAVEPVCETNNSDFFSSKIPPQRINPEYARQLIPLMFSAIEAYAKKLALPVPLPLTTNNVRYIKIYNNGGWPQADIDLTNGWRFVYRHAMVNGYYSAKVFQTKEFRPFRLDYFAGQWNLTTNQAIDLVKRTLARLDYPTNNIHLDFAPNVIYASGDFKKMIPRYFFEWNFENAAHDDLLSKVEAEVNADSGTVESLYYDGKMYWNERPAVTVPITLEKIPSAKNKPN